MGCSSPRAVFFLGDKTLIDEVSATFWRFLNDKLKQQGVEDSMSAAMEKMIYSYQSALQESESVSLPQLNYKNATVMRVDLQHIANMTNHCGQGFFFESFIEDTHELIPVIDSHTQTISYLGMSQEQLAQFAIELSGKGVDRFVPFGQALAFSETWDGYSLLSELTKHVSIQ